MLSFLTVQQYRGQNKWFLSMGPCVQNSFKCLGAEAGGSAPRHLLQLHGTAPLSIGEQITLRHVTYHLIILSSANKCLSTGLKEEGKPLSMRIRDAGPQGAGGSRIRHRHCRSAMKSGAAFGASSGLHHPEASRLGFSW